MKKWLYLDDVRATPTGFDIRAYTAKGAIDHLSRGDITGCSLDHDLGGEFDLPESEVGNGYQVACWIEEQARLGKLNRITCMIHSANPVGAMKMKEALIRAMGYWHMASFDPCI